MAVKLVWSDTPMATPFVPNTIMYEGYIDGVLRLYSIQAIPGYVIHNGDSDYEDLDGNLVRAYTTNEMTLNALTYDFTQTTVIDGYTAYGQDELFARPADTVPEGDFIYGGGDNAEVMKK